MFVLGSLLSAKCCLSYPTKKELYMAWLNFLLQAELSRVPSPCSESKFYRTRWAWFLQQTTRLPEFFSKIVSMPLPGKHLLRAWHIMETLGHRNKAVSAAMAFTDSQSLSHDTAQVGLQGLEGWFFTDFWGSIVQDGKMGRRHIKKPQLAGNMPLEYPRYSPCLRFGGYRIPITYFQNQNGPMIGEIFGESVCDRIIWELQYLLRNYLDSCM